MNAKFEKWWTEDGVFMMCGINEAKEIWQSATEAAIQSLEVTTELRRLAIDTYMAVTPIAVDGLGIEAALDAVLSALKEQAK